MVPLALCTFCGGLGFVQFYLPEGDPQDNFGENRSCPFCRGSGTIEPWRQVATGPFDHEGWKYGPA